MGTAPYGRTRAVLIAAWALGCKSEPPPTPQVAPSPVAPRLATVRIDVPAPPDSSSPRLLATRDGVWTTWLEPGPADTANLKLATWRPAGKWSSPSTIATADMFVNWADTPSLTAMPDGTLVAHWLPMLGESTYAYGVALARSTDGGAGWDPLPAPHDDVTPTEHGFVSIVPLPEGGYWVIWLDGRNRSDADDAGQTMLMARRTGPEGNRDPEQTLDERVCDCCPTTAVAIGSEVVVAYRDRSPTEVRDISIVRHTGTEWADPTALHRDDWTMPGCPVNGPALAATGSTLVAVWFTGLTPDGAVQTKVSSDAGATWSTPSDLHGTRTLGRIDLVMSTETTAVASFLEVDPARPATAQIVVRSIDDRGTPGARHGIATVPADRRSGVPRMAIMNERLLIAWTDATGDATRLRLAAAPLNAL